MIISKSKLYRKMLFCPRLTLKVDGKKLRCGYYYNEHYKGWLLEEKSFKDETTKGVVDYIYEKYNEVELIWSRKI